MMSVDALPDFNEDIVGESVADLKGIVTRSIGFGFERCLAYGLLLSRFHRSCLKIGIAA
jgi:hypothetical protein